jgi:hypothetical protein
MALTGAIYKLKVKSFCVAKLVEVIKIFFLHYFYHELRKVAYKGTKYLYLS